jgi:colanic acid biosynthesis glycosyl transferase WcaI
MKEASCALISLENAMLGVMSPSKVHANLAMGLPILYVGPQGSNVDEAIRQFDCGASIRPGDVETFVVFVRQIMTNREKHAELKQHARRAFETAYCDRAALAEFDRILDVYSTRPAT